MSRGYRLFLLMMTLVLLAGIAILVYGLTLPEPRPHLLPRNYAIGCLPHG